MEQYIAGLDVGGTTGRMTIRHVDGRHLGEYYGPGCSINTDGPEKSETRYRELVLPALCQAGLRAEDCRGICIAASGVDSPEWEQFCRQAFLKMGFDDAAVIVQNDCEIFLNLSEGPVLVLIAGTGSICFGRDGAGAVVRTGGWSHILSDEGSGFHIGLNVIRQIGNHLDGRLCCPVLYQAFHGQTGITTLAELNDFVNDNLMDKSVIAAFAPLAGLSMAAGEAAGCGVITDSAADLAALVLDTIKKMKAEQEPLHLWLWGSVAVKNETLRKIVRERLLGVYPQMTIGIPEVRALDIAVEVAGRRIRPSGISDGA